MNDKGAGGSSYMQNVGYFTNIGPTKQENQHGKNPFVPQYWLRSQDLKYPFFCCIPFLCFSSLIDLDIAVNGAVLDEQGVLCDPFATTSLLFNVYDYDHLVHAARFLGAVTKQQRTWSHITKYLMVCILATGTMFILWPFIIVPCDGFPFSCTIDPKYYLYKTNCKEIKIEYTDKIKELLYEADLRVGESHPEKVIVKFTHFYNKDAHEICESADCAPNLYFVGQLLYFFSLFQWLSLIWFKMQVSHFHVVVMERIENAKPWHAVDDSMDAQSFF